jgi:hypothetical protein
MSEELQIPDDKFYRTCSFDVVNELPGWFMIQKGTKSDEETRWNTEIKIVRIDRGRETLSATPFSCKDDMFYFENSPSMGDGAFPRVSPSTTTDVIRVLNFSVDPRILEAHFLPQMQKTRVDIKRRYADMISKYAELFEAFGDKSTAAKCRRHAGYVEN